MKYKSDIEKMQVALEEAKKALEIDEVPIGAALFDDDDKLITKAHNRREIDQDPTAHAEILVIKEASQILKTWRLENTTLAITLEADPEIELKKSIRTFINRAKYVEKHINKETDINVLWQEAKKNQIDS